MAVDNYIVPILALDGAKLAISLNGAKQSGTLKRLIVDLNYNKDSGEAIPVLVPEASSLALETVIQFCEKASEDPEKHSDFTIIDKVRRTQVANILPWQQELIGKHAGFTELKDILTYADYLDIPELVSLSAHTIASNFTGKKRDALREYMKCDPTNNYGLTKEDDEKIAIERAFLDRLDSDIDGRGVKK